MSRKIAFFDIDGTLTSEIDGSVPADAASAIRQARNNGHLMFINTGRCMQNVEERYAKLTGRGIGGGIDRYVTEENYGRITDRETLVSAFMKIYHTFSNHIVSVSSYQDEFTQQIMMITDNELRNME